MKVPAKMHGSTREAVDKVATCHQISSANASLLLQPSTANYRNNLQLVKKEIERHSTAANVQNVTSA